MAEPGRSDKFGRTKVQKDTKTRSGTFLVRREIDQIPAKNGIGGGRAYNSRHFGA
jgi:hypothetical protein